MAKYMKITSSIFQNGFGLPSFCRSPFALPEALGVDGYEKQRSRTQTQFAGMADKFRDKMQEFAVPDSKNMIFTEDLKNILYLVENKPEDMTLVHQMMKKFNQQNKHLRFGTFIFGPVIMRMYHLLNQPNEALAAFKDPELDGLFDQLITGQILCDLLFSNGLYKEVLEVTDVYSDKQIQGVKYPRNMTVLAMAACYKLNTAESYDYALKTFTKLKETGADPVRRAISYAAALALKQNAPQVALEILGLARNPNYVTIRNLRILSLAALNRPDDAFPLLRYSIENDNPDDPSKRASICGDVVEKLAEYVQKLGNKEFSLEFERLQKSLKETGQLSSQSLEDLLMQEIERPPQQDNRRSGPYGSSGPGGFQRQSIDKSFRIGQSIDLRPRRNPAYNRERQSLRHEY